MLNRPHPKEIHEWLSPPLLGWSRLCITGQLQHPTLIHVLPWFTLKIQDGIEIVGLGCRWGLSWFLALLQTQSAGHVSSLPMSSKYWELINCMATAQVIFIIIVCLTIFKVPMTKWLLFILALKQCTSLSTTYIFSSPHAFSFFKLSLIPDTSFSPLFSFSPGCGINFLLLLVSVSNTLSVPYPSKLCPALNSLLLEFNLFPTRSWLIKLWTWK